MSTTITAGNATNGLALSADNTGVLELKTGTGAGTTALTLSSTQIATFASTIQTAGITTSLYPLVSTTAVASTSGTAIDFTGIPSWAKRITVMFSAVSLSGTSSTLIQIGSGSIQTTGYVATTGITSGTATVSSTAGFPVFAQNVSASQSGMATINLLGSNVYVASGTMSILTTSTATIGGTVTLSGALDRVRITTVNGTDTFDAGSINIFYE